MAIKKVLVTGSSGRIGRVIVRDLLDHGYDVTGVDLNPLRENPIPTYITNLDDLGHVYGVAQGHDAIVHMGAIPSPGTHPPEVVFQNNVQSTFNVLEAAAVLGINKLVIASSLSALGTAYRFRHVDLHYIPIDEEHPLLAQDAYGLSKTIGETLAEGYARRSPTLSVSSMRLSLVLSEGFRERIGENLLTPYYAGGLWTYIDVRDAAEVCRQALEYTIPGHEAYYIAAPETYASVPTRDLIRKYYPGVRRIADSIIGNASPVDCAKAVRQLGFNPRYLWDGSLRAQPQILSGDAFEKESGG